jgi:hypothetical protein
VCEENDITPKCNTTATTNINSFSNEKECYINNLKGKRKQLELWPGCVEVYLRESE